MFNAKMKACVTAWLDWLWHPPRPWLRVPFVVGVCLAFLLMLLPGMAIIWGIFGFVSLNWNVWEWDVGAPVCLCSCLSSLVWSSLLGC